MAERVAVFGQHEPNTLAQLHDVASRAERAALMADGHLGYVMPIGGVAAYDEKVSVVGVGFDIACGNAAIRTDLTLRGTPGLADRLPALADEIQDVVSFGVGRKNRSGDAPVDHPLFASDAWTALRLLNWPESHGTVEVVDGSPGPGNIVFVEIESSNAMEIFTGFGESGVAAEAVAGRVVQEARRYLAAGVPVGVCLADQLLPLLALGAGGRFRTMRLSRHAQTNADIVQRFVDVRIVVTDDGNDRVTVEVEKV